jgi:membrane protein implicated in regulation of membrane protease activity
MDKEIELVKVQVLADYYHMFHIIMLSFVLTAFAAVLVALSILVLELGSIALGVYFLALVLLVVLTLYGLTMAHNRYSRDLDKIDNLLRQVQNGENLLSLRELKNK